MIGDKVYIGGSYVPSTVEPDQGNLMAYKSGWEEPYRLERRAQSLTSGSGNFVFPEGTVYAEVELVGGGGGRGAYAPLSGSSVGSLAGGGAGGYLRATYGLSSFANIVSRTFNYSVGVGAPTTTTSGGTGNTGGNTHFGALRARGGLGGTSKVDTAFAYSNGGQGGSADASSGNGAAGQSPTILLMIQGSEGGNTCLVDTTAGGDASGLSLSGGGSPSFGGVSGPDRGSNNYTGAASVDSGRNAAGYGRGAPPQTSGIARSSGSASLAGARGIISIVYYVHAQY